MRFFRAAFTLFLVVVSVSAYADPGLKRLPIERKDHPATFSLETRPCNDAQAQPSLARGIGFSHKARSYIITTDAAVRTGGDFCITASLYFAPKDVFVNGERVTQRKSETNASKEKIPLKLIVSDWGHGMALLEIETYPAHFPPLFDFFEGLIESRVPHRNVSREELRPGDFLYLADSMAFGKVLIRYSGRHLYPLLESVTEVQGAEILPEDQGTPLFDDDGVFWGVVSSQTIAQYRNRPSAAEEWPLLESRIPVRARSHFSMIRAMDMYRWLLWVSVRADGVLVRSDDRKTVRAEGLIFNLECKKETSDNLSVPAARPIGGGSTDPSGVGGGSTDPSGIGGAGVISPIGGGGSTDPSGIGGDSDLEEYQSSGTCLMRIQSKKNQPSESSRGNESGNGNKLIYITADGVAQISPEGAHFDFFNRYLKAQTSLEIPYLVSIDADKLIVRDFFKSQYGFFSKMITEHFQPMALETQLPSPEFQRLRDIAQRLRPLLERMGEMANGLIVRDSAMTILRARLLALCDLTQMSNPHPKLLPGVELLLDKKNEIEIGRDWTLYSYPREAQRDQVRKGLVEFLASWREVLKTVSEKGDQP